MIGTKSELQVAEWLDKRRIEYDFQSSLDGGRLDWGGLMAEFILTDDDIILRIEPQEIEQKVIMENAGFTVVDIKDLSNLEYVMSKAIIGEEV